MIAMIASALASAGLSQRVAEKVAPWCLGLAVLLLAAVSFKIWDHFDDLAAIRNDRLEGNLEQLEDQVAADTGAADQRLEDAAAQAAQTEAYYDAIEQAKPGDSDDPDIRLACEQLRNDGQDTTGFPACGGR